MNDGKAPRASAPLLAHHADVLPDAPEETRIAGAEWHPLGQAWNAGGSEHGFEPAWSRLRWHETGLIYEAILRGAGQGNRARSLNDRTWELGDVCEIFLQHPPDPSYLELHVTPENHRLQLLWPAGGFDRYASGGASLTEFAVGAPDWVESRTRAFPEAWSVRVFVPAARLGVPALSPVLSFRTAVCRYHYAGTGPLLSSTALLRQPFFHRPDEWHRLELAPAPAPRATQCISTVQAPMPPR